MGSNYTEIATLYVAEKYRGIGLSKQLFNTSLSSIISNRKNRLPQVEVQQ